MRDHRDADVWRWAVAQREALALLRGDAARPGVSTVRRGNQEITTVSAARGGAAAMRMIATPRRSPGG